VKQLSVIVDLSRCEVYGQCVFAAPAVFSLHTEDCLEFDPAPDEAIREHILRAARACPVQAIRMGWTDDVRSTPGSNVAVEYYVTPRAAHLMWMA
jgi:ferredoxin